jgi:hypothetical protein
MAKTTVQEVPDAVLTHGARGSAGSVSGDLVNPALSMGPGEPSCKLITSPIPLILRSITPRATTRNATGGPSQPSMWATCSPRSTT